jgi:hypothetical protein
MTLAQLRARTRFFIDEPTQQNFADADINIALNIAQQEVAREIIQVNEDFFIGASVAITTTSGTELYPLHVNAIDGQCDVIKLKRLERVDTGEVIPMVDQNEKSIYGQNVPPLVNTAGAGSGISAYLLGNSIGLTPTPYGAAVPLQYYYVPRLGDMVNDTDSSPIPVEFHELMSIRAGIDCQIKDEADTGQLENRWRERMDQLKRAARDRQIEEPKHVRRTNPQSGTFPWLQV